MFEDLNKNLHDAAKAGDLETIRYSWHAGAGVNEMDGSRTALATAAYNGHLDCVVFLVEHGAEVDAQNGAGYTALMCAATKNHSEIAEYLLSNGADPQIKLDGRTAADYAKNYGHRGLEFKLRRAQKVTPAARTIPPRKPQAARPPTGDALAPCVEGDELICSRPLTNRILQEIFNFRAQEQITLVRQTVSGPVEAITRRSFASMEDGTVLERAFETYQKLGGDMPAHKALPARIYKISLKPGATNP